MESDGDRYEIKRFPIVYFYLVLKFAAEILFELKGQELRKDSKSFEKVCYLWFDSQDSSLNQEVLKYIANQVITLQSCLSLKWYQGEVTYELWDLRRIEEYCKFVARLELYGTICQSPQLLKIDPRGNIDISFISAWAKKVIKRAIWLNYNGKFTIHIEYGRFSKVKKDFVDAQEMTVSPVKGKKNGNSIVKKRKFEEVEK